MTTNSKNWILFRTCVLNKIKFIYKLTITKNKTKAASLGNFFKALEKLMGQSSNYYRNRNLNDVKPNRRVQGGLP